MTPARIAYGEAPEQFAELWLPSRRAGAAETVVLVHGGFWRARYGLDLMESLAHDLTNRGYAVWNIEYRRVGHDGGGYPGTLEDVAAAIDRLTAVDVELAPGAPLNLDAVSIIGHSAGGHLAFWAAGRDRLTPGQPGADPALMPRLAVGQGPVGDIVAAYHHGAGNGAVADLMGGSPEELPAAYAVANPRIGSEVDIAVVRGEEDDTVLPPYTIPNADGSVVVLDVPGEGHFDLIDPASRSWAKVVDLLAQRPRRRAGA